MYVLDGTSVRRCVPLSTWTQTCPIWWENTREKCERWTRCE